MEFTEGSVYYGLTVTFKNYYTLKQKMYRFNRFDKYINGQVGSNRLIFSLEYHKYHVNDPRYVQDGDNDNPFKPHIHALLKVPKQLSALTLGNLSYVLNNSFGNTKIDCLNEKLDYDNWLEYIKKDNERLKLKYAMDHVYTTEYKVKARDIDPNFVEESDDDLVSE